MTVKKIQDALSARFSNHKYELRNAYIFKRDWESDFFSTTDSGYCYEVEIKVSRSDFFADFKKYKHQMFLDYSKGKLMSVKKICSTYGDKICDYTYKTLERRRFDTHEIDGVKYDWKLGMFVGNQWDDYALRIVKKSIYAPATSISIEDLSKLNLPHKFFYAAPKGIINVTDIPKYAGFIEVDGNYAKTVKEAPFIHKRPLNLTGTLLEKFFWETASLRREVKYKTSIIENLRKETSAQVSDTTISNKD